MYLKTLIIILMLMVLLVAGCSAGSPPSATSEPEQPGLPVTHSPVAADQQLRRVTLALSYIPNVQFAPYYVARSNGHYVAAGLDVVFDYNFETDVAQRVARWPQSQIEFATVSGASVLLARQQGLPVQSVMTLYQDFPVVFFSKSNVPLATPRDLRGRSIGIPGRFGESFYALLALFYASGLTEDDVQVQEIGFTQAQMILEDRVEVAIGYAMNEPVLLRQQGVTVNILRAADILPLVANGIVVSEQLIEQDPDLVRRFVHASLRGLQDTLDNPDEAFTISLAEVPEAELGDPELQRQVLLESLPYWHSALTDEHGLGYSDPEAWEQTHRFMLASGLLTHPVPLAESFTNEFISD